MKKKTKLLLIIGAAVLAAGGAVAAITLGGGKPVDVVRVDSNTLGWVPDELQMYGAVASDKAQVVLYDKDKTILETYVAAGDTVKAGDPLIRYDATLDGIELELLELQLQKLQIEIQNEMKQYKKYAKKDYTGLTIALPTATPVPTRTPRPTRTPKATATPRPTATSTPDAGRQAAMGGGSAGNVLLGMAARIGRLPAAVYFDPTPVGGTGTSSDPKRYTLDEESISAGFLRARLNEARLSGATVYVEIDGVAYTLKLSFSVAAGEDPTTYASGTSFTASTLYTSGSGTSGSPYQYKMAIGAGTLATPAVCALKTSFIDARIQDSVLGLFTPVYMRFTGPNKEFTISAELEAEEAPTPTPDPSASPTATPGGGGMTKAQREALIRECAKNIRENEVKYRQAQLDLQNLRMQGADGIIRSEIDGTVSKVTAEDELTDGQTYIEVKGSEGYYVRCIVGELNLDKVAVGTELPGFSYQSGTSCTGRVVEVGTVPVSGGFYNGEGNSNASGYIIRIFIEDGDGLSIGDYVEFSSPDSGRMPGQNESTEVYLSQAYVREIDGEDCIYVVRNGVLRREAVRTGKVMYGYVQIMDGVLTGSDYIAFPYDKNAHDGAKPNYPDGADAADAG